MADAAHVVTHRAQPERTHAKVPAPSRIRRMPKDAESLLMYRRFMEERDEILAQMPNPPEPDNHHLDIAILEAWADGLIDDTYLHAEIAKYHKELKECSHCLENVEYYRSRRQQCSGTDAR